MSDHKLGPIGTRRRPKGQPVQFSLYLPRDLFARLEAWRLRQPVPPSRSAVFRKLATDFLDHHDQQEST